MIELDFLKASFEKTCTAYSFLTLDGELILVESKNGSDFLSTVQTARFVKQYFPLENNDWVAVNDPQSGGYNPFGISFVGRIDHIIWSVRIENPGAWNATDKWDTLGLRLPPMPYKIKGELNNQIPALFLDKVNLFEQIILADFQKVVQFIQWRKNQLSPLAFKKYFEESRKALVEKLNDTPWTEALHKSKTKTGEVLVSKVTITQDVFSVDLGGSSNSIVLGLTESMTDSLVTYACVQAMQCKSYYNSGTEKFFQITKPRVSWLSVREPSFPAQVHFLSFPFLESHLKQLLLKMKFQVQKWQCSKEGWMQFQFTDKKSVTSDELQKNWGQNCAGFKIIRSEENSLVFELSQASKLFRVEEGEIETHDLGIGAQFQLALEN
jgi:hypothetical protein